VETGQSTVLPGFPIQQVAAVLSQRTSVGETELIRGFRAWVRNHAVKR
jgi:hypothetical protein